MLPQTGERQVSEVIEGIKPNHRNRYQFAYDKIKERIKDTGALSPLILDCACGVGYGTMMLAGMGPALPSRMGPAVRVAGFDICPDTIAAANRAYKKDNNQFAVCDLGNADSWKAATSAVFGDDPLDAIVSIETIEHVVDAAALIQRYADRSDFLVASVPNEDIVPFDKTRHPFHYRHYTRGQFEELLLDHGYTITSWATQYDKIPGIVYDDADDGMGFIVSAVKV